MNPVVFPPIPEDYTFKWISVLDALPSDDSLVFIVQRYRYREPTDPSDIDSVSCGWVGIGQYRPNKQDGTPAKHPWRRRDGVEVTHWAYRPKVPCVHGWGSWQYRDL